MPADDPTTRNAAVEALEQLLAAVGHRRDAAGREIESAPHIASALELAISIAKTEFARQQGSVEHARCRSQAIFRHSGVPIAVTDAQGGFVETNAAFQKMLGYSAGELAQSTVAQVTHPDDRSATARVIARSTAGPVDPVTVEKRYLKKTGEIVVAETTAAYLTSEDGSPIAVAVVHDITERTQAEAALRKSEARFKTLFEVAADPLALIDLSGRFLEVNDAGCEMLRYDRSELLTMRVHDIETLADVDDVLAAASTEGVTTIEGRVRARSGVEVPIEVRVQRIELDGHVRLLALVRDISDRVRHERLRDRFIEGVVDAQEDERRRVSLELHDAIGQQLTALSFMLRSLVDEANPGPLRERLIEACQMAEATIGETTSLAYRLRPPALDDLGFVESVSEFAEQFARTYGIEADVHARGLSETERLAPAIETALYRIAQEALNNVAKHAGAETVSILILRRADAVQMIVEDDG